jgi:hypothetical protein
MYTFHAKLSNKNLRQYNILEGRDADHSPPSSAEVKNE